MLDLRTVAQASSDARFCLACSRKQDAAIAVSNYCQFCLRNQVFTGEQMSKWNPDQASVSGAEVGRIQDAVSSAEALARVIALRTKDAAQLTTQEWAWAARDADVPTPVSQITRELVIDLMLNEGGI